MLFPAGYARRKGNWSWLKAKKKRQFYGTVIVYCRLKMALLLNVG